MQEGDVQIKGYPVRLPLDLLLVFTANPEDYTARGKIITPLKDRIGSEIRTHYPASTEQGVAITRQEAWTDRASSLTDVMGEVAKYYAEQLNGLAGADAREYLKRRGIDAAAVQRFGIGLAPDSRSALKRALAHLGEDKLIETGMLI
jgi:Mg-chelatase subunit ChlI